MTKQHHFIVRHAAVLGAGVMGAQIAALLAAAGIQVTLFDLAAESGDKNSIVRQAIKNLKKLKPAPFATVESLLDIRSANYDDDLELLKQQDIIIEAVAERMDIKTALYNKIAAFVNPHAIIASNTSGLSVNQLAEALPAAIRERFCGIHFFNPPRYMKLVELIPTQHSSKQILEPLETFLVSTLGKGVLYAKDTPNFIANRIGVFSLLAIFHHAQQFNIPFDVADQLTGPLLGRPKSATFRLADVVGLDTLLHVIKTMDDNLADDPWKQYYAIPSWLENLVKEGALGQKTRKGIYVKQGKAIHVLDLANNEYRLADQQADPEVVKILRTKDITERFTALRNSSHPQAQFVWATLRDLFHYSAYHLEDIAETTRDVDFALRWGFGWAEGPFAVWQLAGWQAISKQITADIADKKTMADAALPEWVNKEKGGYSADGAFAPSITKYLPRSNAQVYQRQSYPEPVLGEGYDEGETIMETDDVRLWHQGDDIAILSFKTKMHTIGDGVLDGILQSVELAEESFKALVLWQRGGNHFSVGANLKEFAETVMTGKLDVLERGVYKFQRASLALRYTMIPTVAAIKGFTFGGGCELSLHCSRIVAAMETYIGLVEVGVGLLPAGGGCKEFALRAAQHSQNFQHNDPLLFMKKYYELIAKGQTSMSALHAKQIGYLRPSDVIVFNENELLYVAKQQAHAMAESNYRPMMRPHINVAGRDGKATFEMMLVNLREGNFISDYDFLIGSKIAHVMCGGDVDRGTIVDGEWLLRLEREAFVELASQEKTQQRIKHTLETGKPLRN